MSILVAPSRIEPARIEEPSRELTALSERLVAADARIGGNLSPAFLGALMPLVSILDATFSNRIEGIALLPESIEGVSAKARRTGETGGPGAHPDLWSGCGHVQLRGRLEGRLPEAQSHDPASLEAILGLHGGLCFGAPGAVQERMEAGCLRQRDVMIADHVPPPHECLPAFMAHFHKRYRQDWLHRMSAKILAVPAAHHRFAFIHPFVDGNGRVGRLQSFAMLCAAGLPGAGLWSLSRALYRGDDPTASPAGDYRRMMAVADRPRQGDRDGRGNLSLAALESFSTWFLSVCLSEAERMGALLEPEELKRRCALLGEPALLAPMRAFCTGHEGGERGTSEAAKVLAAQGVLSRAPGSNRLALSVAAGRRLFPELWKGL